MMQNAIFALIFHLLGTCTHELNSMKNTEKGNIEQHQRALIINAVEGTYSITPDALLEYALKNWSIRSSSLAPTLPEAGKRKGKFLITGNATKG